MGATPELFEQAVAAVRAGDVEGLERLLGETSELAVGLGPDSGRSLLHHATDWPGHWPRVAESIAVILRAGADPDLGWPHPTEPDVAETPLHWAASSGDVAAATALLDAGAVVDPLGGIFDGCTPLTEATIFEMYDVARLLLDRGAQNWLPGAAALGLAEEVERHFADDGSLRTDVGQLPHWNAPPDPQVIIDRAFQFACRSGHLEIARFLLERGADVDSTMPGDTSALDEARSNGHDEVVAWLEELSG